MTAELCVWIAIVVAIVVVGLWPLLRRRFGRDPAEDRHESQWTETLARTKIAELEAALDRVDMPDDSRAQGERALLLAGAALAGGGRKAAAKAGRLAESGLQDVAPPV